jgi:hypothetical protein
MEKRTETKVVVTYPDRMSEQLSGDDMDFSVDDRGYLSIYDYALTERDKPVGGKVFVAAPGHWAAVAFSK